jgi:hypothetical protein
MSDITYVVIGNGYWAKEVDLGLAIYSWLELCRWDIDGPITVFWVKAKAAEVDVNGLGDISYPKNREHQISTITVTKTMLKQAERIQQLDGELDEAKWNLQESIEAAPRYK